MRRLIRADLRRILGKKSVVILFIIMLLFIFSRVSLMYALYEIPFVAVKELMNSLRSVNLVLGVIIFNGIYSDDFRSMSYVSAIGRGIPRVKVLLAKLMDVIIICLVMYGIITLIMTGFLRIAGCNLNYTLSLAWFSSIFVSIYKNVGYIALASMFLYITNNIPLSLIILVLLHILMPFSTAAIEYISFLKPLHLNRINYAGLADNAVADFMFGMILPGTIKLMIGLVLYLGIVILVTRILFDKKELEF